MLGVIQDDAIDNHEVTEKEVIEDSIKKSHGPKRLPPI
jgi:hypothetical protein